MSTNTSDNELDAENMMQEEEEEDADDDADDVEDLNDPIDDIGDDDEKLESKDAGTTSSGGCTSKQSENASAGENGSETTTTTTTTTPPPAIDGISRDNWKLLEKVKTTQRHEHLKGVNFGSPTANDRLMKELRDIFRSDNYKTGIYSVELVKDSLYEWNVQIFK